MAVEVITELVPSSSQTDLKCESTHEMILSIVPKIEKISSPKITGLPTKERHGSAGVSSEEATKMSRELEPCSWEQ